MSDFEDIRSIRDFKSLVKYCRTELGWPIDEVNVEDLSFDFTPEELGLNENAIVKIEEIKQIKPMVYGQPWGIFWIEFESKRLPVTVMRRILAALVKKKRGSNDSDRAAWEMQDLMFISATGEGNKRGISFAHFREVEDGLPELRTFYWDTNERHFYYIKNLNLAALRWPENQDDIEGWQKQWAGAFTSKHREVITKSKDLAERMAELASATRDLVIEVYENEVEKGPLHKLFNSFKELLIHDLEIADFADMYAQTITYGLFSAAAARSEEDFNLDYAVDLIPNTNPFLRDLLEECLRVGSQGHLDFEIDELGVGELVTVLGNTNMEAVIQDFGRLTGGEDPVIHFYETFLKEYDAKKKIQRGVFYTPRPVVSYIVRSVDELLRTEFGLEYGLADTTTWGEMAKRYEYLEIPEGIPSDQAFVQILDPATGTGSFLVEIIDLISRTMVEKWKVENHNEQEIQVLWNEYVPKHLLPRLFGYEILLAPYAIAHLKIGLKLLETGYRFGNNERARIYLTNTLESVNVSGQIDLEGFLPALAKEANSVNQVKSDQCFTIIVGNPPYSKLSSNLSEEMRATIDRYRYLDGERIKERGALQFEINLQDDYVKFFRFCEECIKTSGQGILGMITNNGYLSTPTLRGMRDSLLESFTSIEVLDLHGHLAKGELGPDGDKEENVFDIVQGVALFLGCRGQYDNVDAIVSHADFYGSRVEKYEYLLAHSRSSTNFIDIEPAHPFYLFLPHDAELAFEWKRFVGLTELFPKNSAGIITARDGLVISENKDDLACQLERFSHARGEEESIYKEFGFSKSKRFNLVEAQADLRKLKSFSNPIRKILHRPFDERYIFFHRSVVWSLSRPMAEHMRYGNNIALIATRQVTRPQFEHAFISRHIIEIKVCSHDRNSQIFPLLIPGSDNELGLATQDIANLDPYLCGRFARELGLTWDGHDSDLGSEHELTPLRVLHFIYAVLYCPSYRERYFQFLRSEYPRLPLVGSLELFIELSRLGGDLVLLHLMESPKLDNGFTSFNGPKDPEVGRVGWSNDIVWLDAGSTKARDGHRAVKPGTIGFKGVSEEVWDFHIGGYQVCHKWLKDRKGRTLSEDDINHYQKIIVALNETIRIMGEIDEVIEAHGGWPDAFAVGERDEAFSDEKVIPFPQAGEAEQRPLRKAAEPREDYDTSSEE